MGFALSSGAALLRTKPLRAELARGALRPASSNHGSKANPAGSPLLFPPSEDNPEGIGFLRTPMSRGHGYLCVVRDCYSRKVLRWWLPDTMEVGPVA
jgi:hypothetical protein